MCSLKVLVIEDQHDVAANIWDFLERRGHQVDHAADGVTGLMHAIRGRFDVIVLDLGLPRLDGLAVCRKLRDVGNGTPVLMLTARDTLEDKLKGYAEGADDYLVKPFELGELERRLRALNRQRVPEANSVLTLGPLRFDPSAMMAFRSGVSIPLTRFQAALLDALMRRSPAVIGHEQLAEQIWGVDGPAGGIHNHVYALRALVDRPFDKPLIQSVHGVGYRMMAPDA